MIDSRKNGAATALTSSIADRYARAARLAGPKLGAQKTGLVDGYWLDEKAFYFLAEKLEPSLGRVVGVPSIANSAENTAAEIFSLETLVGLLSGQSEEPVTLEKLASAKFDMPDRETLAVSVGKQDYLLDIQRKAVKQAKPSLEAAALYSPDGRFACFVKDFDLWIKDRESGAERALTTGGEEHHRYGQQSETNLSAISYRKRPTPVGLWSPDSQWFITLRIDERALPELAVVQHAPPEGGRPVLHTFKSASLNSPLPVATYLAFHIPSGRVITFDEVPVLAATFSPLTVRRVWFDGKDTAWCVRIDRYQKNIELIKLDLSQGTGKVVLSETTSTGYIEPHPFIVGAPNIRTLAKSGEIIWFSERDGWGHLYLYDASTGALKNQITRGEWLVRDIVHVDEAQRKVLFLAGGVDPQADPVRRSLCSVNLDGSGFEVLLTHDGDISMAKTEPTGLDQTRPFQPSYAQAGISPDEHFGVVRYTSVERGNRTEVVDLQTRKDFAIASALPVAGQRLPKLFTALAADGVTRLHGVMFFPSDFDERKRYPLVDYIYPGPQIVQQPQIFQSVSAAEAVSLAELGFITVMFDTRGMPYRSRALHQAGYGELLEPQLSDHAAVVRQLCDRFSFIDPGRIGMFGQSGGGDATARTMFDYGDIFKVGVSVCGNHDSSVYSTTWSDKYRGEGSLEHFADQANGSAAHKLSGKLFLISGDMDQNVLVSHTLALADALIRANKDFDLLIVPNVGHEVMIASGYAQRRLWDYFVQHLLGETPPAEFNLTFEPQELENLYQRSGQELR